jgi:ATP-dependent Lhr-like helicase
MRSVRKEPVTGALITISAVDPLNLVGIITPDDQRVAAVARNRIIFRDGVPLAAIDSAEVRRLSPGLELSDDELRDVLGEPAR